MDNPIPGLTLGLQIAGVIQGFVLILYVGARVRERALSALPILYFLGLIAGFLGPVLGSLPLALEVPMRLTIGALPALGYLLILQLLLDGVPGYRHFFVLAVPLLAIPGILVATGAGSSAVCFTDDAASCIEPAPLLTLYDALAGAGVLLALMFVAQGRLEALKQEVLGREKRALVQTIVALMVVLLALDILRLAGLVAIAEAEFIAAALRLTFFYLVASAVFRVFPTAFHLETPAPGAIPARPAAVRKQLTPEEQAHVARITELMTLDKLYQEPGFSRKQLAEELDLPEHHVSRIVNLGFDKSFTELINAHRIDEARQLLADTDQPISQIAFDVGFNSLASFNRVFKASTGLNPTAWREQAGGTDQRTEHTANPAQQAPA